MHKESILHESKKTIVIKMENRLKLRVRGNSYSKKIKFKFSKVKKIKTKFIIKNIKDIRPTKS